MKHPSTFPLSNVIRLNALKMDVNSKRLRHLLSKCGGETIASGEIKPQQIKVNLTTIT